MKKVISIILVVLSPRIFASYQKSESDNIRAERVAKALWDAAEAAYERNLTPAQRDALRRMAAQDRAWLDKMKREEALQAAMMPKIDVRKPIEVAEPVYDVRKPVYLEYFEEPKAKETKFEEKK